MTTCPEPGNPQNPITLAKALADRPIPEFPPLDTACIEAARFGNLGDPERHVAETHQKRYDATMLQDRRETERCLREVEHIGDRSKQERAAFEKTLQATDPVTEEVAGSRPWPILDRVAFGVKATMVVALIWASFRSIQTILMNAGLELNTAQSAAFGLVAMALPFVWQAIAQSLTDDHSRHRLLRRLSLTCFGLGIGWLVCFVVHFGHGMTETATDLARRIATGDPDEGLVPSGLVGSLYLTVQLLVECLAATTLHVSMEHTARGHRVVKPAINHAREFLKASVERLDAEIIELVTQAGRLEDRQSMIASGKAAYVDAAITEYHRLVAATKPHIRLHRDSNASNPNQSPSFPRINN